MRPVHPDLAQFSQYLSLPSRRREVPVHPGLLDLRSVVGSDPGAHPCQRGGVCKCAGACKDTNANSMFPTTRQAGNAGRQGARVVNERTDSQAMPSGAIGSSGTDKRVMVHGTAWSRDARAMELQRRVASRTGDSGQRRASSIEHPRIGGPIEQSWSGCGKCSDTWDPCMKCRNQWMPGASPACCTECCKSCPTNMQAGIDCDKFFPCQGGPISAATGECCQSQNDSMATELGICDSEMCQLQQLISMLFVKLSPNQFQIDSPLCGPMSAIGSDGNQRCFWHCPSWTKGPGSLSDACVPSCTGGKSCTLLADGTFGCTSCEGCQNVPCGPGEGCTCRFDPDAQCPPPPPPGKGCSCKVWKKDASGVCNPVDDGEPKMSTVTACTSKGVPDCFMKTSCT